MGHSICSVEGCVKRVAARGWCSAHYRQWKIKQPGVPCSTEGCERVRYARGLCTLHYDRARWNKGTWAPLTAQERFWAKVAKTDGCWNWQGPVNPKTGYGYYNNKRAHRLAYEWLVGPIPKGLHIDHVCFNRICVNPEHLRAITQKQNNENHRGARSDSSTGVRGVWRSSHNPSKWLAAVKAGDRLWSRTFDTIEEAEAAAIARRNEVFTHNDLDRRESA